MKKQLILFLVVFSVGLLSSCSSDDDGGSPPTNTVVGSWSIDEFNLLVEENGIVVFDETASTNSCNQNIIFTFQNSGSLTTPVFELDFDFDIDGNASLVCEVEDNNQNGTWENINGNIYFIAIDGETNETQINFSNSNNTFEFILTDNDGDEKQTFTLVGNRV